MRSVAAVLCARSPMRIFQSPELPGGAGETGLLFLGTGCIRAVTTARSVERHADAFAIAASLLCSGQMEAGSDETEPLFLLGPSKRKLSREPGYRQVGGRAAFRDGLNDARRQIGERR